MAMLTYLNGVQPLGSIEAEMALWLTPPGGDAQEGRIEFLAQALNLAKVWILSTPKSELLGIHSLA